jgi:hypothetical protein
MRPKVFAALMARESDLRLGFAPPFEHPGTQDQPAASRSELDGMASNQLRLVEATRAQLPRMQRYRDNHQRTRTGLHPSDRFRQHAA